jgi:osmotically-inducible protein OsmY
MERHSLKTRLLNLGLKQGEKLQGEKPMKKSIQYLSVIACLAGAVTFATFTTGCAGDRYSRSTGQTIDDASITAKVKSSFIADPEVKALDVKVDTYRGEVQLTGFADSMEQKRRAEQLARGVEGVQMVKNDIIVKTMEPAGAERSKRMQK